MPHMGPQGHWQGGRGASSSHSLFQQRTGDKSGRESIPHWRCSSTGAGGITGIELVLEGLLFVHQCSLSLPAHLPTAPSYDTNNTSTRDQDHASTPAAAAPAAGFSAADRAWQAISVPNGMGLTAVRHKWRQNLSHVEVFVRLPDTTSPKQVGD